MTGRVRQVLHSRLLPVLGAVFSLDCLAGLVVMGYGNSYLINVLRAPSSYPAYALGIYGVVKLTVALPGGWLLDRLKPGTVAFLAGISAAAGLAGILATKSAVGYFVGVGLISLGSSLAWLDVFHVIGGRHDASERGGVMASVGVVSAGATGAGLGTAAVVGEVPGWRLAFLLGVVISVAATAFLLAMSRQGVSAGGATACPDRTRTPGRQRLVAALVLFLHFSLISGMLAALAPFALRTLDLSLLQTGIAVAPAGALGAGAMLFVGRRSRAATHLRTAAALYVFAGVGLAAVAVTSDAAWFAFASLPLGIGIGGATPLINASVLDAARAGERNGVALGYLFFAEGLGSIAGPLVVGLLIAAGSERTGVASVASVAIVLAGAAGWASRQARL